MKPISPLDLVPLSGTHHYSGDANERMKNIKKFHEEVQEKILKHNEKYIRMPISIKDMLNSKKVT